ncbi:MAG: hypothetical protein V1827_03670 [Candidatus Micrarchaeota archaeon]
MDPASFYKRQKRKSPMNPDVKSIVTDFLSLISTWDIAIRYGLPVKTVKSILHSSMPRSQYLRTSYAIGAKKVSEKLKDPGFKVLYSQKMKASVSSAIREKMQNPSFKEQWRQKAATASLKGNERIKKLLGNPEFSASWSKKCSEGAHSIIRSGKGIFDPDLRPEREKWSLLGLKRTGKKSTGPLGEHMYNYLEVRTADILLKYGLTYVYEKRFSSDNINGFISLDFYVNEIPLLIEVTYWDKVDKKCHDLIRKSARFQEQLPERSLLVITKRSMRDHYKRLLPDSIIVLIPCELEHYIAGFHLSK